MPKNIHHISSSGTHFYDVIQCCVQGACWLISPNSQSPLPAHTAQSNHRSQVRNKFNMGKLQTMIDAEKRTRRKHSSPANRLANNSITQLPSKIASKTTQLLATVTPAKPPYRPDKMQSRIRSCAQMHVHVHSVTFDANKSCPTQGPTVT